MTLLPAAVAKRQIVIKLKKKQNKKLPSFKKCSLYRQKVRAKRDNPEGILFRKGILLSHFYEESKSIKFFTSFFQ